MLIFTRVSFKQWIVMLYTNEGLHKYQINVKTIDFGDSANLRLQLLEGCQWVITLKN